MSARSTLVEAPAGPVLGTTDAGVRRFLGIPYAQAPIGALRFAAPEWMEPFATRFEALQHGATPQRVALFEVTTIPEPSIPGDATLTLDIFAPERTDGAPILFWIHGGGYIAGSPASPWFDGSAFARDGVIVVNASYRLGIDGFAALPGAPLNRGIRDLIAALRWVQLNARAFGGDPGNVTIAGQSAGGGAVLALLASPAADGLFRAAVSVSGIDISLTIDEARASTIAVATELGVEPTVEGFGPYDDGSPMRAILRMRDASDSDGAITFGPVHGDDILPEPISLALATNGTDKPVLLGATADEFDGGPTPENPVRPDPRSPQMVTAKAAGTRITDTLFRAACVRVAAARSQSPAATWLYSFNWPSPVMQGATHCIDVPFLFDNLHVAGVREALGEHPPKALADAMHADLVRFAGGADPAWPRATAQRGDASRVYTAEGAATIAPGAFDACLQYVAGRS